MINTATIRLTLTEHQAHQLYTALIDTRPPWKRLLRPIRVDNDVISKLHVALRDHRPPRNQL